MTTKMYDNRKNCGMNGLVQQPLLQAHLLECGLPSAHIGARIVALLPADPVRGTRDSGHLALQ